MDCRPRIAPSTRAPAGPCTHPSIAPPCISVGLGPAPTTPMPTQVKPSSKHADPTPHLSNFRSRRMRQLVNCITGTHAALFALRILSRANTAELGEPVAQWPNPNPERCNHVTLS